MKQECVSQKKKANYAGQNVNILKYMEYNIKNTILLLEIEK